MTDLLDKVTYHAATYRADPLSPGSQGAHDARLWSLVSGFWSLVSGSLTSHF